MEDEYIISESELIDLLASYHYAKCLDADTGEYIISKSELINFLNETKNNLKYYIKIKEVLNNE